MAMYVGGGMRIGIIGCGNMGSAIINGAMAAGWPKERFGAYDLDAQKALALGVEAFSGEEELLSACDIVLLAVKPNQARRMFEGIGDAGKGKAFVSNMAGLTYAQMFPLLPAKARLLRVMPNTPLLAGEGASVFAREHTLTDREFGAVNELYCAAGMVFVLPELMMDAVTAVSGSGPAYAFMFIEAMADAAVREGIPRDVAYALCAQTVKGAAQMVIKTGKCPAELKDAVTSPSGTTIEALAALEKGGLRAAVLDAVRAAAMRSRELSG